MTMRPTFSVPQHGYGCTTVQYHAEMSFFRDDANFTMLFCSAPIDRPLLTICRMLRQSNP